MNPLVPTFRRHFDEATRGLPRTFWTLWAGLLVNRLGAFVIAFLATYLVRERGLSAAEAGRIVAVYGLGITAAGPLGGTLADKLGRRATMGLGLLAGGASAIAIGFVTSLPGLSVLAFVAGVTEIYRPAMNAAVADLVPAADRQRAYGLVYWAVNFGLAVGWLLGSLIAGKSILLLFLADGATSFACAAIILLRVPETRPPGLVHEPIIGGMLRTLGDGQFSLFLLMHLASLVVFCQWQLGLPLDMAAHGLSASSYALLMGLNCVAVVILQPILSPKLRGHDSAKLLCAMALLLGCGYGVNALGGALWTYALGTTLWSVGEVIGFPAASALVADLSPVELRGRYQGAFSMMFGMAFTLGPLLGGEVLSRGGGRALWGVCFVIAVAVAGAHLAAGKARRARLARPAR